MNILLLSHGVPYPPDSGPRVKTYQLIRHLATRHQVTLVCLARHDDDLSQIEALHALCTAITVVPVAPSVWHDLGALATALIGHRPFAIARHTHADLHGRLARLVDEAATSGKPFDLVHACQITMASYAEVLPLPRLFDAHNATWTIAAQLGARQGPLSGWPARREAALLRAYEARVCADFEAVTTVNEDDRTALGTDAARPNLRVIPIGIDGEALPPVTRDPQAQAVLSLATPGWPPNAEGLTWFARRVYPLVRRAVPTTHLYICGAQPTIELRRLAIADRTIEVTGVVSPQPYLERAAVMIAPLLHSGGMRVMLPEALARGVPVVATSMACAGLDLIPGEHVLVADTPSDFADTVTLLLRDYELGSRIAAAARRFVLERYDWRVLYPTLDLVYATMTAHSAPQTEEASAAHELVVS